MKKNFLAILTLLLSLLLVAGGGEKNDVDKLMSLQEELDNIDNKILEKYQEYEETEIELKSL